MTVDQIRRFGRLEDIGEWLEENAHVLWERKFKNQHMLTPLKFFGVRMRGQYGSFRIAGREVKGVNGVLTFRTSVYLTEDEISRLFEDTGILLDIKRSYILKSTESWKKAVELEIDSHSIRYALYAHEWVNLCTMMVLSCET